MGIGARLTFAFFTVIVIMVFGHAGYTLFLDYKDSRSNAIIKVNKAIGKLDKVDFSQILVANQQLANVIMSDQSITNAYNTRDRNQLASALKALLNRTSFNGFVAFIDDRGNVFYSTDSPAKFGYSAQSRSPEVDFVLQNAKAYHGPACFTDTGTYALSSMIPYQGNKGIVTVSLPLDEEFLTGLCNKLAIEQDPLLNIDMALVSGDKERTLVAATPKLIASKCPYLVALKEKGVDALPRENQFNGILYELDGLIGLRSGYEQGGRWWGVYNLPGAKPKETVCDLLVTTPVMDLSGRLISVVLLAGTCGVVGFLFSMLFTAGISKGVNAPLNFLINRTNELANQRTSLPPLEGLSGQYLELGELIDTAVSSMRTSVQSMKLQLSKQHQEVLEKSKVAEDASVQLDALNRQFSSQSRQLTETQKQISFANRQSVLLQHKLDSVLQVSTEGFLILDQYGNVLSANPVFLNWIGATEGEIAGRLCFDLVKKPGESRNTDLEGQAFARHGGNPGELINQFYPEGIIYHRTKEKVTEVLAHLQPVMSEDSTIESYIMVLRDKSLRSEIAALRTEIVAMLQDSIRAPLTAAEGTWNMILLNAAQSMHPSVGQPLAELHAHYEQMIGVIDSLLMIYGGYVPSPAVQREQIVVTRLVAECLEEVAPQARSRQLAMDYKSTSGLPNISANREAVKGILIQVLERMIGVTAAGGRVRVECLVRGNEMRIGVSSSGPALPEQEIVDMFVGFIQGKHAEATYSARLSMYLARNNVERLGGKIWAESEAGRGTAIYFILPVQ